MSRRIVLNFSRRVALSLSRPSNNSINVTAKRGEINYTKKHLNEEVKKGTFPSLSE